MTTPTSQNTDSGGIGLETVVHIVGLLSGILGVVVVYVFSEDGFEKANARNAINWQILVTVLGAVSVVVFSVIGWMPAVGLAAFVGVANLGFCVWASVKSTEGIAWEYPLAPRIL
jgi:uncharacterized Tic20 family protein